jgi:ornithine carbamoyltransferase
MAPLHRAHFWSLDTLSDEDLSALADTAFALKRADAAGQPLQALRGKNVAVIGGSPEAPASREVSLAASALGARVAHLAPGTSPSTAALLGKLYDVIECEGLPPAVVREVARAAGRPVFHDLASPHRALLTLDTLMSQRGQARPVAGTQPDRHYVLQALLCSSVSA